MCLPTDSRVRTILICVCSLLEKDEGDSKEGNKKEEEENNTEEVTNAAKTAAAAGGGPVVVGNAEEK